LQILNSSSARQQMELLFGAPAVRRLEARRRVEQIMEMGKNAVSGNSTTALQQAALQGGIGTLAGAGAGLLSGNDPFTTGTVVGLLAAGNKGLRTRVNAEVFNRVGRMLASNDPRQYEAAINLIVRNERLLQTARQISSNIERAGAGTVGGEVSGP